MESSLWHSPGCLPCPSPPPPKIPPSLRNENHFLSGFLQRQKPCRPEVISGMCVNTEFNGMLFAPLSCRGLRRVNMSLFYEFLALRIVFLRG